MENTLAKELKPCPNPWGCGGTQTVCTHANFDGNSSLRHVVCHNCGLRGPTRTSEAEAIAAWNTRLSPEVEVEITQAMIKGAADYWREKATHKGKQTFALPGGFFWSELLTAALAQPIPGEQPSREKGE